MKVRFRKQVHGSFASVSSQDRWLYRDIDLPVEPFIGLQLTDEKDWYETIKEITFNLKTNRMDCWTEDDKELYNFPKKPDSRELDEIIKEHVEAGWKLDKEL